MGAYRLVLFSIFCVNCISSKRSPVIQPYSVDLTTMNGSVNPRIYGGNTAYENQFPYMVFHLYSTTRDYRVTAVTCSAGLVRTNWVLLAAHCFGEVLYPDPQWSFVIGGKLDIGDYLNKKLTNGGNNIVDADEKQATTIFVNPLYNTEDKEHDIALIMLKEHFVLNERIQLIPVSFDRMTSRTNCVIHGWGLTVNNQRSSKLMYANVYVKPIEEGCNHKQKGDFICVEKSNAGICRGDSGSPLVCENKVWGVASHLVAYELNPRCGEDMEEYYTSVWHNLEWLKSTVMDITTESHDIKRNSSAQVTFNLFLTLMCLLFHF